NPEKATALISKNKDPQARQLIADYLFNASNEQAKKLKNSLKDLRKERAKTTNDIKEIMVMGDLEEPRPTFILDRGMYNAPTDQVEPGIPET
ncbi:hypothetical protein R0K20_18660, partial [Staphylococcus sp. SIMBA_130]